MLIDVYDTTLRDGTQREGISLGVRDKVRIAQTLDALGVAYIEAGWPGSNPKDAELFRLAQGMAWTRAKLVAFGSTCRAGVAAEDDTNLIALVESQAPVCTIFGKSSPLHVREVLRVSSDENLRMIEESVAFLVRSGRSVIYDAEHFFDGLREDARYAIATLFAAKRGGAEVVVLCDTNGGTLPSEIAEVVACVHRDVGGQVGIHAHDDAGCAVANSIAAVRAGATHVQGTINGYGERCGNANLTTIVPTLELKLGYACLRPGALEGLGRVSRIVAEIANLSFDEHAPYVGRSAFAHKGGVHVAAIRRSPRSYEHVDPALVGNRTRVIVSELSGRANVRAKAEELGHALADAADVAVLDEVKEREARGFSFESAEASVALLLRRKQRAYAPPFELVDYKVIVGQHQEAPAYADATIKVRVRGVVHHTAAEGNGPVSALDAALRKALAPVFPEINAIHLEDFKVRILDGSGGTSATTRVLVDHAAGGERFTTVGASPNILEAALTALVDGIEHGLWLMKSNQEPSSRTKGVTDEDTEDRAIAG